MIVEPIKQDKWLWPAVWNLWMGGAGVGFFLFVFMVEGLESGGFSFPMPLGVGLVSVVLMGLGFLLLSIELGRPSRGIYLLFNLGRSSISQEAACAFLFIGCLALNFLTHTLLFTAMAALAGTGLLICQGLIVYREQGIPAWHVPAVPFFFLVSGLYSGAGIHWMIIGFSRDSMASMGAGPGILFLLLNGIAWLVLQIKPHRHSNRMGKQKAGQRWFQAAIIGIGHLLPLLLIFAVKLLTSSANGCRLPGLLLLGAGFLAVSGVGLQKKLLIRQKAYTSGINSES